MKMLQCVVVCLLAAFSLGQTELGSFDRIMIVNLENQGKLLTIQRPFLKYLSKIGTYIPNYFAITHPSQPNYITQIAGDFFGIKDNNNHDLVGQKMVGDLLVEHGFTWKSYQEDFPGNCFTGTNSLYYRKHNPFMSFTQVTSNLTYCSNNVEAAQLYADIKNDQLPNLIYYTPNILNDGHDTGLDYADKWLHGFLCPLITNQKFMNGTLIVITFDEDDYLQSNNVYMTLIGPMIPISINHNRYNHYSLLRTIEDNFGLGTLGRNDVTATSFKINAANKYTFESNCTNLYCKSCGAYDTSYLAGVISGSIIGGIAGVILIVATITLIIVAVVMIRKRRKKNNLNIDHVDNVILEDVVEQ